MVKDDEKGRKMTGFQRHQKIVVLVDILKRSQTSMAEVRRMRNIKVSVIITRGLAQWIS